MVKESPAFSSYRADGLTKFEYVLVEIFKQIMVADNFKTFDRETKSYMAITFAEELIEAISKKQNYKNSRDEVILECCKRLGHRYGAAAQKDLRSMMSNDETLPKSFTEEK